MSEGKINLQQQNEALPLQPEWCRVILASIGDAVITTDSSGGVTFLNPVAQSLTGWTQEEAAGQPLEGVFRIINKESRQPVESPTIRALREGVVIGLANHTLLIARDGTERSIEDRAAPIRNEQGAVTGVVLVFRDSERSRQEQAFQDALSSADSIKAVQTSEVRYRRLFETAKDGILILDANTGRIIDANPFMTELLGYSQEAFLGKELWEIGLFKDKSDNEAAFRELQKHGYIRYNHLPLETEHGRKIEVEFVSNVYQVDGGLVAQCNIRDISERSRLERQLKEQTEALADLHRRKDEFLAMLAHELRNPLAPISNAVHLLRLDRNEAPLQQQACILIERQMTQLTRLVDDLLEVSRIATGRVQLRKDRIKMSVVVERAVETARPGVEQRGHELTVSLPPRPIWLDADAVRLEQVAVNLLNNAAKYTDEAGHIWLTLAQEGEECVLRVRDTGVGIAPELLPRVFDLFTQAERSLDRSEGGLGIGLALVRRLVEMHGGRVEAHSSLGRGSEFVVRLPVVASPDAQPLPLTEVVRQPTGPRLRVLAVDDNVDAAESLAMLLKALGHDVRTAHNGQTALETSLVYLPNVVLLDIGLPRMNGYEVAKRMRQQPTLENVLLVAMTGYGRDSDRQLSQEAGFDHHLVKPADLSALEKLLASVKTARA